MPLRAIAFDLDGTLVDSLQDIRAAVNHAMNALGIPDKSSDWVRSHVGQGAAHLLNRAVEGTRAAGEAAEALRLFIDYYDAHPCDFTRPYPGATEVLETLAREGAALAILSNKPTEITRKVCRILGLAQFFLQVWGGDSFPEKKPSPFGLHAFMAQTGVAPDRMVMVGDSEADVACAVAAGVRSLFHRKGYGGLEKGACRPDFAYDDIRELPSLIAKLN